MVLVIEDGPTLRELLCELLREENYRVIVAADGREGLALAMAECPRAILVDLGLPVTSGWEVIRHLRASERTVHTPVIVLTGHSNPADDADGQQPEAVMGKPFDLSVHLDHVARAVQSTSPDGVPAAEHDDAV
jgi:DNA-binding response OmpR family regulator